MCKKDNERAHYGPQKKMELVDGICIIKPESSGN